MLYSCIKYIFTAWFWKCRSEYLLGTDLRSYFANKPIRSKTSRNDKIKYIVMFRNISFTFLNININTKNVLS